MPFRATRPSETPTRRPAVAPLQTSDLLPLRLRPRSTSQPLPPGCMNSMQLQATGASKSRTPGPHSGVDCGGGWTRQAPHTSPKRMAFSHFLVGYTHSGILMCIAMCIAPAVCWSRLNGFVVELSCSILAPPIEGVYCTVRAVRRQPGAHTSYVHTKCC